MSGLGFRVLKLGLKDMLKEGEALEAGSSPAVGHV